ELAIFGRIGNQAVARRHDVRLRKPVVVRRTARAEPVHAVIAVLHRVLRHDGADREGRWRIPRRSDSGIPDLSRRRIAPIVSSGRDDDDPGARRRFDSLYERIGGGTLEWWMAEREIDDVETQRRAVRNNGLDSADHIACRPAAGRG